jgi:hypothetical protein
MSISAGPFFGGVLLTLLAGVLNGGWNVCVKASAPPAVRAISAPGEEHPYKFEHAWSVRNPCPRPEHPTSTTHLHALSSALARRCLGMFHAAWFNLAACTIMLGPGTVGGVVSAAASKDLFLIVFFSFLWGLGTFGFGLAIQIAGIGMGTTLTMSVIVSGGRGGGWGVGEASARRWRWREKRARRRCSCCHARERSEREGDAAARPLLRGREHNSCNPLYRYYTAMASLARKRARSRSTAAARRCSRYCCNPMLPGLRTKTIICATTRR